MHTAKEGIQGGAKLTPADGAPYHEARVSAAASLADLSSEYAFFTHAALFCFAEFDRDPVFDYIAEHDPSCRPFHLDFPDALFTGLNFHGDPAWNHRLLAVPHTSWRGLDWFLCGLSGVDRNRRRFHRVLSQSLPVPDALALARASVLPIPCPMVTIITYGISSTEGVYAFAPAFNPPIDLPQIVHHSPEEETLRLARAILGEDEFPFRSIQEQGSQ